MEKKGGIIYQKIEDMGSTFRVHINIGTKCLSLVIIQEINGELFVYKTSMILEQNLKRQADKISMSVDSYFEKLISFFQNPCRVKFDFQKTTLTLIEDVSSHVKVKYFQCNLEMVKNSYIGSLIDDLYSQKSQSEIQCKELMNENELLQKDVNAYKDKLNELVDRKIIDEKTMLSSFVSLLNEKKSRIQHLNELLEAFRSDSSLADPAEVNIANRNKRKLKNLEPQTTTVKEEISESESSHSNHDILTDDEQVADSTKTEITAVSKYNDIFDESPTESHLPKLPKLSTSKSTANILPSTSKEIHSDLELKKDNKSSSIESYDAQMMNVDTQEWLENL